MSLSSNSDPKQLFNVRTITCFVKLDREGLESQLPRTIHHAATVLNKVQHELSRNGYIVQTVRLVTNPFPEWMPSEPQNTIVLIDELLSKNGVSFCALGPAKSSTELKTCELIVAQSHRLSCSARVEPSDVDMARAAAQTVLNISQMDHGPHVQDGLGNFRFCTSHAKGGIPFFPVAYTGETGNEDVLKEHSLGIAIGLENGKLARRLLAESGSLKNVATRFRDGLLDAWRPLEQLLIHVLGEQNVPYVGIDTSLNPSLDEEGSIAGALEQLEEVSRFGGPGSLAAAAAVTRVLQSLPLRRTGYCGLMLPVCEDARLVELANADAIRVHDLLSISHVCGVGVDTVPLADNTSLQDLTGLILDVVGLAARWDKPLSCRVFPVPGKSSGETTTFDSPYMMNAKIFSL